MKTNRRTPRCEGRSDLVRSTVFATLLAISFAALAVGNARAGAVRAPTAEEKDTTALPNGTVLGTLTINGKPIKLNYVYARIRLAPPPRDVRLYHKGEVKAPLTEVIITNQSLTEDTLISILEDQYHGSDKLRGIMLIMEPSEEHQWVTYFLLQSGTVPQSGMTGSRGEPMIENGRVTGKIEYKNEDVLDVRTYSVSFNAPLKK